MKNVFFELAETSMNILLQKEVSIDCKKKIKKYFHSIRHILEFYCQKTPKSCISGCKHETRHNGSQGCVVSENNWGHADFFLIPCENPRWPPF